MVKFDEEADIEEKIPLIEEESPNSKSQSNADIEEAVKLYIEKGKERSEVDAKTFVAQLLKKDYGLDEESPAFETLAEMLDVVANKDLYSVAQPRHILLVGPPGTGKSLLMSKLIRGIGGVPLNIDPASARQPGKVAEFFELARQLKAAYIGASIDLLINGSDSLGVSPSKVVADKYVELLVEFLEAELAKTEAAQSEDENKDTSKDKKKPRNTSTELAKMQELFSNAFVERFPNKEAVVMLAAPSSVTDAETSLVRLRSVIKDVKIILGNSPLSPILDNLSDENLITLLSKTLPHPPILLFIDEVDAISNREIGANPSLNQLLSELDGAAPPNYREGIVVIAATNKPEKIDSALLREGRMEKVFVAYPNIKARLSIAKIMAQNYRTTNVIIDDEVLNLLALPPLSTGADILGLTKKLVRKKVAKLKGSDKAHIDVGSVWENLADIFSDDELVVSPGIVVRGIRYYIKTMAKAFSHEMKNGDFMTMKRGLASLLISKQLDDAIEPFYDLFYQHAGNTLYKEYDDKIYEEDKKREFDRLISESFPFISAYKHTIDLLFGHMLRGKGYYIRVFNEDLIDVLAEGVMLSSINFVRDLAKDRGVILQDPYLIAEVDVGSVVRGRGIVGQIEEAISSIFDHLKMVGNTVVVFKNTAPITHQVSFDTSAASHLLAEGIEDLAKHGKIILYPFSTEYRSGGRLMPLSTPINPRSLVSDIFSGSLFTKEGHYLSAVATDMEARVIKNLLIDKDINPLYDAFKRHVDEGNLKDSLNYLGGEEFVKEVDTDFKAPLLNRDDINEIRSAYVNFLKRLKSKADTQRAHTKEILRRLRK